FEGCHLNTHTGEEPHACNFCGERFKDPSKRHKHMTRHHAYRPSKSHKKFKADNGHLAPHESVAFSISSSSSPSVTSVEHE
ncbi:uncharacterized protein STEHIDRAFT_60001, partial [Stereum hirsutum FP-91666 SS1]|uniref:uncharacterized protein n=1 Tax=Stereum hirsutum (strain FP-91666) TaxID=721885 RepID=UPI00044496F6